MDYKSWVGALKIFYSMFTKACCCPQLKYSEYSSELELEAFLALLIGGYDLHHRPLFPHSLLKCQADLWVTQDGTFFGVCLCSTRKF